ncbi:hypothetical protein PRZ48_011914 [Zasmidium cellare]|uniref:F-box domain-containing protein n=1 Tax=Zasmidium cellare TaxID=395010 RepID=A0ABR0E7P5_ZASCE|nr:hypothetical protein PRZ48_011914 [Zasmidium cellare]
MADNRLFELPDELLEAIVSYLPPTATLSFGTTSRRANKITYEPLVWRRHCRNTWRYWEKSHVLEERLELPPTRTKWRQLFNERRRIDREAQELFDQMLTTQQWRFERMEKIASWGYDVKDLLLQLRDATPDDAEDVLCRRYYANAILGQVHRATALEKWTRLQKRQMVRLEEILGAYDLFVLSGEKGDLDDMDRELDRLAAAIRARDEEFDDLSIRRKAVQIAKFLRSENLVGNPSEEDYHALRNNFISMALFDEVHTSLPLQSVAIYCAVARRLGVNAKPSNYPQHVHAVIEAPADQTLDGRPKVPTQGNEPELMHMDPWRTSEEVPNEHLTTRLTQMGAPISQHHHHLGPTSTLEIAMRTSRNIMHSVQESRERQRGISRRVVHPDIEAAWYSMLWSMLVLGDSNSATTLHRRRQCLPYLVDHFQAHFPEDIGLIEKFIPPMFESEREHNILMHLITTARTADRNRKAPSSRTDRTESVRLKIGTHFKHRRYGYEGVIVGWDIKCGAEQRWMEQMRVDDLPRGREQPFYNSVYASPSKRSARAYYYVVGCTDANASSPSADDKSVRYVAEENIEVDESEPGPVLMQLAGRYFKRWDKEERRFVSNIKDEYPDD